VHGGAGSAGGERATVGPGGHGSGAVRAGGRAEGARLNFVMSWWAGDPRSPGQPREPPDHPMESQADPTVDFPWCIWPNVAAVHRGGIELGTGKIVILPQAQTPWSSPSRGREPGNVLRRRGRLLAGKGIGAGFSKEEHWPRISGGQACPEGGGAGGTNEYLRTGMTARDERGPALPGPVVRGVRRGRCVIRGR